MEVNLKSSEWCINKIEPKSKLKVTENLSIMTEKKYNWLQKKMWKMLLNIEIEDIKE